MIPDYTTLCLNITVTACLQHCMNTSVLLFACVCIFQSFLTYQMCFLRDLKNVLFQFPTDFQLLSTVVEENWASRAFSVFSVSPRLSGPSDFQNRWKFRVSNKKEYTDAYFSDSSSCASTYDKHDSYKCYVSATCSMFTECNVLKSGADNSFQCDKAS